MKKKLMLITLICLGALTIWGLVQNPLGLELKIGYTKTTQVTEQDRDDQEDQEDQDDQEDSDIYDIFGNKLD